MRTPSILVVISVASVTLAGLGGIVIRAGQATDAKLEGQLKRLFPAAATFSPKAGTPPHFKALSVATGENAPGRNVDPG